MQWFVNLRYSLTIESLIKVDQMYSKVFIFVNSLIRLIFLKSTPSPCLLERNVQFIQQPRINSDTWTTFQKVLLSVSN